MPEWINVVLNNGWFVGVATGLFVALILWAWRGARRATFGVAASVNSAYSTVLEPLPATLPDEIIRSVRPSQLLLPQRQIMPFRGRRQEMAALRSWCLSAQSPRFFLLAGGPLSGKTRLWIEFTNKGLGKGWRAGLLRPGHEGEAFATLSQVAGRHLVVIETMTAGERLSDFLRDVATMPGSARWRILLVCRTELALPRLTDPVANEVIRAAQRLSEGSLKFSGKTDDRARWRNEAKSAFAAAAHVTPAAETDPEVGSSPEPIGVVVARGLADALGKGDGAQFAFEQLGTAELARWPQFQASDGDIKILGASFVRRLFALAWLFSAVTRDQVLELVKPARPEPTVNSDQAVSYLTNLYPGQEGDLDLPSDVIAAPIAVPELLRNPEWVIETVSSRALYDVSNALGRLLSVIENYPLSANLVDRILTRVHLPMDSDMLIGAGKFVYRHRAEDELLAAVITAHPSEDAAQLDTLIDELSRAGMHRATAATAGAIVAVRRQQADENPALHTPDLAVALDNYATRLANAGGHPTEALQMSEEALTLYRKLADGNPDQYTPDLARTLHNYATRLGDAGGHPTEALEFGEKAVILFRKLADGNPDRYTPDLAITLDSYASQLTDDRMHTTEVLQFSGEALALCRELVMQNPSRYMPDLAMVLLNHAARLVEAGGYRSQALQFDEEALNIYRKLAEENASKYTPGLARALHNYGTQLANVGGRATEALQLSKEAVKLNRELADENPDLYTPHLIRALHNHAVRLKNEGKQSVERLRLSGEVIALSRGLVGKNPVLHIPALALALHNHAIWLSDVEGHSTAALACNQEALDLYRDLVETDRTGFSVELARTLHSRAVLIFKVGGRTAEALRLSEESLTLYRELSAYNTYLYTPELVTALNDHAGDLTRANDHCGAVVHADEALKICMNLNHGEVIAASAIGRSRRLIANSLMSLGYQQEADAALAGLSYRDPCTGNLENG